MGDHNEAGAGAVREERERTYLKVWASFTCVQDPKVGGCGSDWTSRHFWISSNPVEWMDCQECHKQGLLLNAWDTLIPIDNYHCKEIWGGCGKKWQEVRVSIEMEYRRKVCEKCKRSPVLPEPGPPEELFGRHYLFQCQDDKCAGKRGWQKASFEENKCQRCRYCYKAGDVMNVQMVRMTSDPKGFKGDRPRIIEGGDHLFQNCDMCLELTKHRGIRTSCSRFDRVVTRTVKKDGIFQEEEIIDAY